MSGSWLARDDESESRGYDMVSAVSPRSGSGNDSDFIWTGCQGMRIQPGFHKK